MVTEGRSALACAHIFARMSSRSNGTQPVRAVNMSPGEGVDIAPGGRSFAGELLWGDIVDRSRAVGETPERC